MTGVRRVRSVIKTIHLWIGLSLGVLLALVTLAGATLLWEDPIVAATHPELVDRPLPPTAQQATALGHLLALPQGQGLRGVALPSDDMPVFEATARGGDKLYFDAGTGQYLQTRRTSSDFMLLVMAWHTKLLSGEIGETILGIVALAGLGVAPAGLRRHVESVLPFAPQLAEQPFAVPVPVHVRCVEEINAGVDG